MNISGKAKALLASLIFLAMTGPMLAGPQSPGDMPFSEANVEDVKREYERFVNYVNELDAEISSVREDPEQVRLNIKEGFLYEAGRQVYIEKLGVEECAGGEITLEFMDHGEVVHTGLGPTRYYIGNFRPLPAGLRPGMSMDDVRKEFGTPAKQTRDALMYNPVKTPGEHNGLDEEHRLFLYFRNRLLEGVKLTEFAMC